MKPREIIVFILVGIVILSIFQIALDYIYDASDDKTVAVSKEHSLLIFIEVEDKKLYVLENDKCIKEYTIVSGRSGLPSPIGMWKIVEKADWGEGFGGTWMGFNVPWGKYGIHGSLPGDVMGIADSQGCIRMKNEEVAELSSMVPYGTTVVIVNGSFGPFGQAFAEINPGDRGADVYAIQQRLKELGFFKGWVSGIYGEDFKYGLHRFQKANNLPENNVITRRAWMAMGFREFQ